MSSSKGTVTVGSDASLTMENIGNSECNIKFDAATENDFIVSENAIVNMSARVDNVQIVPRSAGLFNSGTIDFAKGSNVTLEVITGSNFHVAGTFANKLNFNGTATLIKQNGNDTQANIEFNWLGIGGNAVNFNPGADVTLIAGKGASNIGASSSVTVTVNINDPLRVAFNTDKLETDNGVTYLGNSRIIVNVENATIKVDDNDFSELISSNKTNITGSSVGIGSVSLNSNSTSYANESESLSASLSFSVATSTAASQLAAVNNGSQVIYGESTSIYNSQLASTSLSQSTSTSTSLIQSESASISLSQSESASTSLSQSESTSTSLSQSESASTSLSQSESASTSLSQSTSASISGSISAVIPHSDDQSVSLSNSQSISISISESISTSLSSSESLSTSLSLSGSESASASTNSSTSVVTSVDSEFSSISTDNVMNGSVSLSLSFTNGSSLKNTNVSITGSHTLIGTNLVDDNICVQKRYQQNQKLP